MAAPGQPEEIARHLRERVDALAEAVLTRVRAAAPDEAAPDAATLRNLRLGARAAVDFFLARLAAPAGAPAPDTALFVAHGRAQQAAGRSLPELLAFYRLGGLAMWEGAQAIPVSRELPRTAIFDLGAAVMATVDELSAAALEGFTAQEAETLRQELARRERLASLLLSDRPCPARQLAAAAAAAGWELPQRLRVAVAALPLDPPPGSGRAGPERVLAAPAGGGCRALVVADDEEAERWLLRAVRAQRLEPPLAIGPAVAPAEAARSLTRAAALLAQAPELTGAAGAGRGASGAGRGAAGAAGADRGAAGADRGADGAGRGAAGADRGADDAMRVLRCDDHEIDLLLSAAPELARAIATRRLAPFAPLPPGQRERLLETLRGWLAHPARPQAIADALGIHVQTVRYRLRQLRALLGDAALDEPESRFELSVALRIDEAGSGDA